MATEKLSRKGAPLSNVRTSRPVFVGSSACWLTIEGAATNANNFRKLSSMEVESLCRCALVSLKNRSLGQELQKQRIASLTQFVREAKDRRLTGPTLDKLAARIEAAVVAASILN